MKKILVGGLILVLILVAGIVYSVLRKPQRQSLENALLPLETQLFPSPSSAPQPIKLLFGGDLLFDRHIRLRMAEHGPDFILAPLQETLGQYDMVVANLEGPITDSPSRSVNSAVGSTNNFIFTFDPTIPEMLKKSHFSAVNLGNNHILNFGIDGVAQTKKYLSQQQIQYFGDTSTEKTSADRVLIYPIKGLKIGLVNYNQFVPKGYEHALDDLAYVKDKADVVIVYTHWGIEYQTTANQVIQTQAHAFIDNGADIIIGSHPHVQQQSEEYHGKRIYYSLGNFVFDQYFSPETQEGLLVGVEIDANRNVAFEEIPIKLATNGQSLLLSHDH